MDLLLFDASQPRDCTVRGVSWKPAWCSEARWPTFLTPGFWGIWLSGTFFILHSSIFWMLKTCCALMSKLRHWGTQHMSLNKPALPLLRRAGIEALPLAISRITFVGREDLCMSLPPIPISNSMVIYGLVPPTQPALMKHTGLDVIWRAQIAAACREEHMDYRALSPTFLNNLDGTLSILSPARREQGWTVLNPHWVQPPLQRNKEKSGFLPEREAHHCTKSDIQRWDSLFQRSSRPFAFFLTIQWRLFKLEKGNSLISCHQSQLKPRDFELPPLQRRLTLHRLMISRH